MRSPGSWKEIFEPDVWPGYPNRVHLTAKTLAEMYAGRRVVQSHQYRNTMPPLQYAEFVKWIADWKPNGKVHTQGSSLPRR